MATETAVVDHRACSTPWPSDPAAGLDALTLRRRVFCCRTTPDEEDSAPRSAGNSCVGLQLSLARCHVGKNAEGRDDDQPRDCSLCIKCKPCSAAGCSSALSRPKRASDSSGKARAVRKCVRAVQRRVSPSEVPLQVHFTAYASARTDQPSPRLGNHCRDTLPRLRWNCASPRFDHALASSVPTHAQQVIPFSCSLPAARCPLSTC